MKKHLLYCSLTVLFFSCGEKNEIPDGIIPQEKMIEVMSEIELTQALIKLKLSTQDTVNHKLLFNEVYDEFDISQDQFNKSINYYCKDPKLLLDMYEDVVENLSQKQSEQRKK